MPREPVGLNGQEKTVRTEFATRAAKARAADEYPSIEIDQEEEARFLRAERRVPVRRISLSKKVVLQLRRVFVIAIAATALGCVAWAARDYGRHSWRFRIDSSDNVEITGVQNAPSGDVRRVARDDLGRNVFFISLDERKQQLERIPWVESATVMRVLPNRISIHINERTPVAFVQIGPKISLIDSNGVVMGPPASRQTKYSFPVVRGITETEPLSSRAAAMKIYNRMARELDSGGEDGPRYTRQLSEVDLSDPEDIKVVANEGSGTLLVHLGSQDFLERYKLYLTHVKEWRQQFPNLQSVDLRYEGQIVVNPDAPHTGPAPEKPTSATETPKHREKQAVSPPEKKVVKNSGLAKKPVHRGGAETRRKQKKRA
ncbi:MAG TPA: FtsQ-type POTRA domain-containing protein [Candidatus Angelobacter sp.]